MNGVWHLQQNKIQGGQSCRITLQLKLEMLIWELSKNIGNSSVLKGGINEVGFYNVVMWTSWTKFDQMK